MRSFEQYDETHKYFAGGRLANEVQKSLQLYDLSVGEYLFNKYALWLDLRTMDENKLHGMGRQIENTSGGITIQIEKKAESAGSLNAYIYLIMDAQLNIQNGAYVSAVTCELYYRFSSFLALLSVGIITSRCYLSEHNKNGGTSGTSGREDEQKLINLE